jgi:hypothetical protein
VVRQAPSPREAQGWRTANQWTGGNGRLGNGGLRGGVVGGWVGGGGVRVGVVGGGGAFAPALIFFWTTPDAPTEQPSCDRRVRAVHDAGQLLHVTCNWHNAVQLQRCAVCNV